MSKEVKDHIQSRDFNRRRFIKLDKLKNAGIAKVVAEFQTQINDWKKANG
jgi:hypothetical protein